MDWETDEGMRKANNAFGAAIAADLQRKRAAQERYCSRCGKAIRDCWVDYGDGTLWCLDCDAAEAGDRDEGTP